VRPPLVSSLVSRSLDPPLVNRSLLRPNRSLFRLSRSLLRLNRSLLRVSRSLLRLNRSLLRLNRSLLASQECETETEAQAGLEEIVCVCV
jgi:hypothetical protein